MGRIFSDAARIRLPKGRGHLRDGGRYQEEEARRADTWRIQLHERGASHERETKCGGGLQRPETDGRLYELGI